MAVAFYSIVRIDCFLRIQRKFLRKEFSVDVPDPNSTLKFWKALWEKPAVHKNDAEWLGTIANEVNLHSQANLEISLEHVKFALKGKLYWRVLYQIGSFVGAPL